MLIVRRERIEDAYLHLESLEAFDLFAGLSRLADEVLLEAALSLKAELARAPLLLAIGDFNIAPSDRDVHDPRAWAGKVLCSAPERAALGELLDLGLVDLFRQFPQADKSFSWWDYRGAAFRRNQGLRIDLMLASAKLSQMCHSCSIDREPRGWERPSDHVPVVAEFTSP